MSEVTEPQPTTLTAFDRHGVYLGSADMLKSGRWSVTIRVNSIEEARNLLAHNGAKTITEGTGLKQ